MSMVMMPSGEICTGRFGRDSDMTVVLGGGAMAGISRLVRESCDFIIDIPLMGQVNSLNASAAAAVLLYEIVRQRHE